MKLMFGGVSWKKESSFVLLHWLIDLLWSYFISNWIVSVNLASAYWSPQRAPVLWAPVRIRPAHPPLMKVPAGAEFLPAVGTLQGRATGSFIIDIQKKNGPSSANFTAVSQMTEAVCETRASSFHRHRHHCKSPGDAVAGDFITTEFLRCQALLSF